MIDYQCIIISLIGVVYRRSFALSVPLSGNMGQGKFTGTASFAFREKAAVSVSASLVEILSEGLGLFLPAEDAALPPGAPEAAAVAEQLHEGGGDGVEADARAAVAQAGIDAHQQGVQPQRSQRPRTERRRQHQHGRSRREQSRQQVDHLQRLRVFLVEIDARHPEIVYLLEKLLQVHPPLVVDPCLREQAARVAALEHPDAEVDVLAEAHPRESSQGGVHFPACAHVEAPGIELVHFLFSAPYAAGGEEGSHGVVDGFLHVRERRVRPVGASEHVRRLPSQFPFHCREVARRQDAVRVEDDKVVPGGPLRSVIARLAGA